MSPVPDAADIVAALTGAAQADLPPGTKLATIDPAYTVGGSYPTSPALPRVTFDGETTLSTKQYPVLNGYLPVAGQRVLMVPSGRTFVIAGPVTNAAVVLNRNTTLLAQSGASISLDRPPGVRVGVTAETLVSGVVTPVNWDLTYYEVGGTWWSAGTPATVTVPALMGGWYDIGYGVTFAASGAGNLRIASLLQNGVTIQQGEPILEVAALFPTRSGGFVPMVPVAAGDTFQVTYSQNAGVNLAAGTTMGATFLTLIRRAS